MRQCRAVSNAIENIQRAVRDCELGDKPICIHSSLRSFDPRVDADAVIDAFLGEGCTVMTPTFSHEIFGLRPPPYLRPARNGTDYDLAAMTDAGRDRTFDPSSNELSESMGTLPRILVQRPGRLRGRHPVSSFTAFGPLADTLVSHQRAFDVYAPLAGLAKADGYVVLMGVDLDRMTLIHLAEKRSGRKLFRRWANGPDGRPMMLEHGGCSQGFPNLAPALAPIRRDLTVGGSRWQVFPAKAALNMATHAIRRNQRITHCGAVCARCDDSVAGGPVL